MTTLSINQSEIPLTHTKRTHASVLLKQLIAAAPSQNFTLEWLIQSLPNYSFGFVFLILAVLALVPFVCIVARSLIIILTWQVLLGYEKPKLPRHLLTRPLPSKYLLHLKRLGIPTLQKLEVIVRPRWFILLNSTRKFSAFVVMIGMTLSLFLPFPFANVPPAIVGMFLALSYIEQDGFVLLLAHLAACLLFVPIIFLGYSLVHAVL